MLCAVCFSSLRPHVHTYGSWKLSSFQYASNCRNVLLCACILFIESGGRKLNENKALTSKKARFDPYGKNKFAICRICKSSVHQPGSHYCQGCAYKKGICSMCGKKVLDTKNYKQTSV
uniref:Cysteine-rich PDZ-binding protein n=1 Tax=Phasianus colchicus TaxID=9054 RepID=A0A669PIX0_PHACC